MYIRTTKIKNKNKTATLFDNEFSKNTPSSFDFNLALRSVTNLAKGKNSLVFKSTIYEFLLLENV
jgi:hypothetical protein